MPKKTKTVIGSKGPPEREPIRLQIPEFIHILGQHWDVDIVPQWSESAVGECDPQKRLIRIRAGISPWLQMECFLHEMLHACLMAVGIEHDEQVVNSLAPVLLDTLNVNKVRFF
jgi:hypothetical protein